MGPANAWNVVEKQLLNLTPIIVPIKERILRDQIDVIKYYGETDEFNHWLHLESYWKKNYTLTALVYQLKSQSVKQILSKPFLKEVSYLSRLCLKKEP